MINDSLILKRSLILKLLVWTQKLSIVKFSLEFKCIATTQLTLQIFMEKIIQPFIIDYKDTEIVMLTFVFIYTLHFIYNQR